MNCKVIQFAFHFTINYLIKLVFRIGFATYVVQFSNQRLKINICVGNYLSTYLLTSKDAFQINLLLQKKNRNDHSWHGANLSME